MSASSRRTRTFAVVAVLAVLVVALLWRLANTPSRGQSAQSAAQSPEPAGSGRPLDADTPVEPVVERSTRSAAPGEFEISGSVRIASPNGPVGEHLEGSLTYAFELESQPGVARETHTTQVSESSWRIVARDGATLHWRSALVGGRRYSIEPASTVIAGDEPVRLLLHPPRALQLRVVDAQTGEQLDGLELQRAKSGISEVRVPPDAKTVPLGEGLASPITLAPLDGVEVLWVRRAGYAWSRAVVDHREDVDRCVALHAACEARVRIDGPLPPGNAYVLIEYLDGQPSDADRARQPEKALVRYVRTEQLPA